MTNMKVGMEENKSGMAVLQETHKKALAARDANARYCTLASLEAGDQAQPRTRTLVTREITETSCLLFVNRSAQKNLTDLANARVEILFFYPTLMSQFRLRGSLSLLSADELESHWRHKPYEAKLLDHFYANFQSQSTPLVSREALEKGLLSLKEMYPDPNAVPFNDGALGLVVTANYLEVWQANDSGIHERQLYCRSNGQWSDVQLVP